MSEDPVITPPRTPQSTRPVFKQPAATSDDTQYTFTDSGSGSGLASDTFTSSGSGSDTRLLTDVSKNLYTQGQNLLTKAMQSNPQNPDQGMVMAGRQKLQAAQNITNYLMLIFETSKAIFERIMR